MNNKVEPEFDVAADLIMCALMDAGFDVSVQGSMVKGELEEYTMEVVFWDRDVIPKIAWWRRTLKRLGLVE